MRTNATSSGSNPESVFTLNTFLSPSQQCRPHSTTRSEPVHGGGAGVQPINQLTNSRRIAGRKRKEGGGAKKAEKAETKATHPASNVKRAVPITVATTGPSNTVDADSGGGAKEGDGGGGGSGGGT